MEHIFDNGAVLNSLEVAEVVLVASEHEVGLNRRQNSVRIVLGEHIRIRIPHS